MNRGERQALIVLKICGALLMFSVGLMALPQSIRTYRSAQTIAAWPEASGTVTESGYSPIPNSNMYSLHVAFEYDVDGIPYANNIMKFGDQTICKRFVDRYPKTSTVGVFYNPKFPVVSLLDPNTLSVRDYSAWIANVVCLLGGVLIGVHAIVSMRRRTKAVAQ